MVCRLALRLVLIVVLIYASAELRAQRWGLQYGIETSWLTDAPYQKLGNGDSSSFYYSNWARSASAVGMQLFAEEDISEILSLHVEVGVQGRNEYVSIESLDTTMSIDLRNNGTPEWHWTHTYASRSHSRFSDLVAVKVHALGKWSLMFGVQHLMLFNQSINLRTEVLTDGQIIPAALSTEKRVGELRHSASLVLGCEYGSGGQKVSRLRPFLRYEYGIIPVAEDHKGHLDLLRIGFSYLLF